MHVGVHGELHFNELSSLLMKFILFVLMIYLFTLTLDAQKFNENIFHNQQLSRTRKSCFRFQFENYWFFLFYYLPSFIIYFLLLFCNIAMCLLKFISFVLLFSCNYLFLHSFHFNFILPRSHAPSSYKCFIFFLGLHCNNFTLHDCEFKCAKSINLWAKREMVWKQNIAKGAAPYLYDK